MILGHLALDICFCFALIPIIALFYLPALRIMAYSLHAALI